MSRAKAPEAPAHPIEDGYLSEAAMAGWYALAEQLFRMARGPREKRRWQKFAAVLAVRVYGPDLEARRGYTPMGARRIGYEPYCVDDRFAVSVKSNRARKRESKS